MPNKTKKNFVAAFEPDKRAHSKKVNKLVKHISTDPNVEQAALFHDFIEQGGDIKTLKTIVTPKAVKLVKKLTNKEGADVLKKLKKQLKNTSKDVRDKVIKIKLADRADNFYKRQQNGKLNNKYVNKTAALVNYLYKEFSDSQQLKKFIRDHFLSHKELSKKIQL